MSEDEKASIGQSVMTACHGVFIHLDGWLPTPLVEKASIYMCENLCSVFFQQNGKTFPQKVFFVCPPGIWSSRLSVKACNLAVCLEMSLPSPDIFGYALCSALRCSALLCAALLCSILLSAALLFPALPCSNLLFSSLDDKGLGFFLKTEGAPLSAGLYRSRRNVRRASDMRAGVGWSGDM